MDSPQQSAPQLERGVSLGGATALNMIDMIGVGPFITIPLIITAMGGPQAMVGWIVGALLALCDGMVWAELGATYPGSGGSYRYLKEIYGSKWGRFFSFLFIWQLSFSAPLSIASGCIGLGQYATYPFPSLQEAWAKHTFTLPLPYVGDLTAAFSFAPANLIAVGALLVAMFLLYRRVGAISTISKYLWVGVMGTIAWVIFAGLTHFSVARAFDFPPNAFTLDHNFFLGLGAAMLVSTYDYWGYYNVCFFGDEVKDPARNIPRALIYSILAVGAIYIVMNISILGVLPWRDLKLAADTDSRTFIVSTFMERIYGSGAANVVSLLIMVTAFASVFALLMGYSRVPYAAAKDGNYFSAFSRVHEKHHIPHVSLLALGAVAVVFCFLRLQDVIAALVVIRILVQFLVQTVGLIVLRTSRPEVERPFRMWLYPLPALFSSAAFVFVLISRPNFQKEVRYAVVLVLLGTIIFLIRSWRNKEWPFAMGEQ